MKNHFRLCALLALPLLSLGSAGAAYDPAIVASDARWVVYLDLNGLRASTLGKELVAALEKAQTQTIGGAIGIDIAKVLTTVGTLTAYGTNLSSDPKAVDGALIAQGTADLRKIAESLLLQGTLAQPNVFSEVTDLPFPAYAISDPKAAKDAQMQVIVAFPPEPIVIVGKSKAHLLKARDVFRGAAPSLAKVASSPLAKLAAKSDSAYAFVGSIVPTEPIFPKNAPQARILQLVTSGAIALGERGADTFVHADLLATSDSNAEKLMKILQGMTSMLSLAESNDRQLAEFLTAAAVTREKENVTLDLAYPSARLAQMVQNLQPRPDARGANRAPSITNGRVVAEWGGDGAASPSGSSTGALVWRTIENVPLANGTTITLGRALIGGKNAHFDRVEIAATDGTGTPLVFRMDFMRSAGPRGSMAQFQFPGADGTYTLKVAYVDDPDGKTKFAVSVRDPRQTNTSEAKAK